jgi:hypothetical protein
MKGRRMRRACIPCELCADSEGTSGQAREEVAGRRCVGAREDLTSRAGVSQVGNSETVSYAAGAGSWKFHSEGIQLEGIKKR